MRFLSTLGRWLLAAAILGLAVTAAAAFCDPSRETYALFGCADLSYFAPVPAPWAPSDVSAVFWQIGFGNGALQTAEGTDGTGVASKGVFNGNDSGLFVPNLYDAYARFHNYFPFPPGSTCLGSNNWANFGIDGCCDNPRSSVPFSYSSSYTGFGGTYLYPSDDDELNPYQAQYLLSIGYPGYYSLASIQDYPTALLLKTPGDSWFSLSAVASQNRHNNGDVTGPCNAASPGTNPAACDAQQGWYEWRAITNGEQNALRPGNDVVPWQQAPRPRLTCLAGCSGGAALKTFHFEIDPVRWYHDGSSMPTNNPTLATRDVTKPRDATRAAGVGVVDLLRRWNGLVQYDIEGAPITFDPSGTPNFSSFTWAPLTDPNGNLLVGLTAPTDPLTGEPTGRVTADAVVDADSCFRAHLHFGKPPETDVITTSACRIGECGDVGYELAPETLDGIQCIGGVLISETIQDPALDKGRGRYRISWRTSVEVTVTGFEIQALTSHGATTLATVACTECSSGLGADYSVEIPRSAIKGGRLDGFRIVMEGGNGSTADLPVR